MLTRFPIQTRNHAKKSKLKMRKKVRKKVKKKKKKFKDSVKSTCIYSDYG